MFSCIHNGIVVFVKANKVARAKHTNEALLPRYSYSAKGRLRSFEALFMILLRHKALERLLFRLDITMQTLEKVAHGNKQKSVFSGK